MIKKTLVSIVYIALVACAAGGGETGTGQDSNTVVGTITRFGSVFVNGVEYEINDNTSIILNGQTGSTASQLQVGMVVTLVGSVNTDGVTGAASSITFDDNVRGTVTENTLASNNQLKVLGQVVVVDDFDTVFESSVPAIKKLADIQVNNVVEVSGYTAGDGTIYATRIEVKQQSRSDGEEVELKGLVSSVTESTFIIGDMTIVYDPEVLKDFAGSELANGDYVEVKSVASVSPNQLVASEIELKNPHSAITARGSNEKIEVEGVVSSDLQNSQFAINGQLVLVSEATQFENGGRTTDIVVGKKVKVTGRLNADKQIVASEVEIKQEEKTKVAGLIEDINNLTKTISVLTQEISISNATTLIDDREERRFFNFSHLLIGDYVEISYYVDSNGNQVASKLKLESESEDTSGSGEAHAEWEIKGDIVAFDVASDTITVLNHRIEVDGLLALVDGIIGREIEVKGSVTNAGVWVANELELKDMEDDD
ncbi:MAG TPA: hypothetical protein ENK06_12950 [Gammaproteobacteria bacterium]|nr:hypothetical protein [Gammaproteobacteria bacterium]